MAELVADCMRCGAGHVTFDVPRSTFVREEFSGPRVYEAFCICRRCRKSTIFILAAHGRQGQELLDGDDLTKTRESLNRVCNVSGYVSLKDRVTDQPPEHLPDDIKAAFVEGSTCMAVRCFNAAATMFRLCLDFATRAALPPDGTPGLNRQVKFSLGHRLPFLFEAGILPPALKDLSTCVKEDGNDGAHEGTLSEADAEDLRDFTVALLERMYTEPAKLAIAKERREARRREA